MSFKEKLEKITNNASFANIIGAVFTVWVLPFLLGLIVQEVRYHDVISYNNINTYIESELVDTELVDKDILSLENPFEQIQKIASIMSEQKTNYDKSLNEISGENEELKAELEELEGQKLAKLSSPDLNILGESKSTTLNNYMATIDGHTYYLEGFLNTFLPDEISYNEGIIKYGKDVPDKINAVSEGLIYDPLGFEVYKGDKHFKMGNQDYSIGVASEQFRHGSFNIECNGEYSEISFVLGHVDDTGTGKQTLTLYYLDNNNAYQIIRTIELSNDTPTQVIKESIYNTKTVRVTTQYNSETLYGLADIYLIK